MASVSVSWKGTCAAGSERDELMSYIMRLAEMNDALLREQLPERRHPLLELMTARRQAQVKPRDNVESIERVIGGHILINANIMPDAAEFEQNALRLRLPTLDHIGCDAHESEFVLNFATPRFRLLRVDEAHVTGVNFRIYDPRQLYPGEDRVSFVFLRCPQAPFLDGCICEAFHHADCPGLIDFSALPGAEWYVRCPEIHLRYYLEEWFDRFLSWVKFFFMPSLYWCRWEDTPGFEAFRTRFERQQRSSGWTAARDQTFESLTEAWFLEAAKTYADVAVAAAQGPATS